MMLKQSLTKLLGRPTRKQTSNVVAESSSNSVVADAKQAAAAAATTTTPARLIPATKGQLQPAKLEEDRSTSVSEEEEDSDNDETVVKSIKQTPQASPPLPLPPPPPRGCLKQLSHGESLRQRYGADTDANGNDHHQRRQQQRSHSVSNVDVLTDTTSNGPVARSSSFVRFSTVQIHQHPVILGDNPACSRGPPLSIDWEAFDSTEFSIDDLENSSSSGSGRRRRQADELVLPKQWRVRTLRQCGYSRKDFRQAKAEIKDIQRTRADGAEEFLNRLRRLGMGALPSPEDCQTAAQVAAMKDDGYDEDW